ncbi:MAG: class III signal peptide-containing protein [Methanobrevibacter sp.]|uniref:class III signal peptide-containing protein n=1 Tax=Methanobrevibacter sp. TaxID=66852 RepID=UPI0026DFD208|nr:class III signal peptide-containing protein [Methanobrevibacter sp.]MDO5848938.1 class III signal peptide-containing protein [Methanobrevibacter sp.]
MDEKGQVAAELILIIGGMIVIVMIGLIFYKNYLSDLSKNIKNNEVNGLNNKLNEINNYFK